MATKVLLLEDEPSIADNITYTLATEGFQCVWCATGADATATLEKGHVDLIVLDVGLPDCNGFEWCRNLRKSHDIPVIFLTARSDEIDRVVGLEIGGDDYMVKPFSPRELAARVKAILRRTVSKQQTKQNTTGFEIDYDRCLVRFRSVPLSLSRYEYRLLCVFVEKPGWVFSREKLMDLVWDEPEASMDRTVDAHIKSLRAKLRTVDADADPIKTHRGMGYALREEV